MEMDCNLKRLANVFKFFLCIVEKSLKTDHGLFFSPRRNPLIVSSRCSSSNFMLEKRFFVNYLSSFDQTTAKSP